MIYILLPFVAWVIAGCCKFVVNFFRHGSKAKALIGYGGFPSTHTTVLSSVLFLEGFSEGFCTAYFSFGVGVLLLMIIDAHGLRRKVGEQAAAINKLQEKLYGEEFKPLRERMGHQWHEIGGGLLLGLALGWLASLL